MKIIKRKLKGIEAIGLFCLPKNMKIKKTTLGSLPFFQIISVRQTQYYVIVTGMPNVWSIPKKDVIVYED